jgi:hypothetical protein
MEKSSFLWKSSFSMDDAESAGMAPPANGQHMIPRAFEAINLAFSMDHNMSGYKKIQSVDTEDCGIQ